MNILITGASGFIGSQLVFAFAKKHHLTLLGRDKMRLMKKFPEHAAYAWEELFQLNPNDFDAVIHLSGFNISDARWTTEIKKKIIDSRVKTTEQLGGWLITNQAKTRLFCANAVGIYGAYKAGDHQVFDENSPIHADDFLHEVGSRWFAALQPVIDAGIPVVSTRFGVVLKKGEGLLKKLYPSFYCCLGSVIGDGQQIISWVHIDDVIGAFEFLLSRPDLKGVFNVTSPSPVCQAAFAQIMASVLNRPLCFKIPAFFIRMIFGEMGEFLLLRGQYVMPKRLTEAGYVFQYAKLDCALKEIFS